MPDYITERELNATIAPLQADIWEIKADVKALVLAAAAQKGADEQRSLAASKTRFLSDRRLAYAAIIAGLVAPIGWLHIL